MKTIRPLFIRRVCQLETILDTGSQYKNSMVKFVFVLGIAWINSKQQQYMNFFSTYNVQIFENNKWKLILNHDLKSIDEAQQLFDNCVKLNPSGKYKIVEHLN